MHKSCVRLGKLPYVVAIWAAMGLGVTLFPFETAEAVSEREAGQVQPVQPEKLSSNPIENMSLKGAILSGHDGALRVVDGDTLAIGAVKIRLHGIDAPEMSQSCSDMRGDIWACGAWSKAVLERLAVGAIACVEKDRDRYGRSVAVCYGAEGDLNAKMVRAGAAYAYAKYSRDYVVDEEAARAGGHGLWRAASQPPAEYRAEKRTAVAPQMPPSDCAIKGNISGSGKLYHMPGGRWYEGTRINVASGERWFCSENEARAAGWRKAKG